MPATASHLYPEASSVEDGRLQIGGCDAVELAREFGTSRSTPSPRMICGRAGEFRAAMGDGEVVFASKAFSLHRGPARVRGGGPGRRRRVRRRLRAGAEGRLQRPPDHPARQREVRAPGSPPRPRRARGSSSTTSTRSTSWIGSPPRSR